MTVKLMHPGSQQVIEVADSAAPRYLGQGWRVPAGDAPKASASLAKWQEYAQTKGFSDEDLDGLTKAEIRAALA